MLGGTRRRTWGAIKKDTQKGVTRSRATQKVEMGWRKGVAGDLEKDTVLGAGEEEEGGWHMVKTRADVEWLDEEGGTKGDLGSDGEGQMESWRNRGGWAGGREGDMGRVTLGRAMQRSNTEGAGGGGGGCTGTHTTGRKGQGKGRLTSTAGGEQGMGRAEAAGGETRVGVACGTSKRDGQTLEGGSGQRK